MAWMNQLQLLLLLLSEAACWQPQGVDPYVVLGLERSHSLDSASLKKAYRKAALRWHPDKVSESEREEAERRFVEIAWAYEVLGDPVRRREFDEPPKPGQQAPPHSGQEAGPRDFDMKKAAKVFKDVFGDFSEEYQDLINHLALSSRSGSQEEWKRHAEALKSKLKEGKAGGNSYSVETESADGSEKIKTTGSMQDDGRGTVRKTVTTQHTQTSSGPASPHTLPGHGHGGLDHYAAAAFSAHAAHTAAAQAAHKAAHEAAVKAAQHGVFGAAVEAHVGKIEL